MASNSMLENFTVVWAENQTKGRGQHNSEWITEPFKNLTFSTYISFKSVLTKHKKYLNFAISLAVYEVLNAKNIPKLFIKWPNDILSGNKKICGILIENTFSGSKIKNTIVGIGLNVNQENFKNLQQKITSIKLEIKKEIVLQNLLEEVLFKIKEYILLLEQQHYKILEESYLNKLYKKNTPTMFKDSKGKLFMGIISGISKEGNLLITLEDDTIQEYGIKEVSIA